MRCLDQFSAPEVMTLAHDFKAIAAPDDCLFVQRIAFRKRLWNCMGCRDRRQHMEALLMADLPLGFPEHELVRGFSIADEDAESAREVVFAAPWHRAVCSFDAFFKNSSRSPINMA